MSATRLIVGLILLLPVAVPATATPSFRARWGGSIDCAAGPLDREVGPSTSATVMFWVERPEGALNGFEVGVVVGDPTGSAIPDAWRFEAGGCRPSNALALDAIYVVDPINRCPYLAPFQVAQTTRSITYHPGSSRLHARLRYAWPDAYAFDSARSYRTGLFFFDFLEMNSCEGVERPICLAVSGGWVDAAGGVHPWPVATPFLTANGGGVLACDAVPTGATTWGSIKAQYR